jgi:hypothetical protein
MFIDSTRFPIVWMHNKGHEVEQTFDQIAAVFEDILVRGVPFVMIGMGTDRPPKSRDPAENKRVSLWIKKNKPRFTLCRSMVLVEPSAVKRVAMGAILTVFSKFWGFSVALVASEAEALRTAKAALADAASPTPTGTVAEGPSGSTVAHGNNAGHDELSWRRLGERPEPR